MKDNETVSHKNYGHVARRHSAIRKEEKFAFDIDGQQAIIEIGDVEIISEDIPGWLIANEGRLTVALDITVTEDLRRRYSA